MILTSKMPKYVLVTLTLAVCLQSVHAQDQLSRKGAEPPDALSSEVRTALQGESFEVHLGGKVAATFWMRKEIPSQTPHGTLGLNFSDIPVGTLLGAVQLSGTWNDYKDLPIPEGVYTLRYGWIPQDGNHMGVSVYRDFALLVPATEDQSLESSLDFDGIVAQSAKSSGTPHPAVMAVFPVWDDPGESSLVKNELDQRTFAWKSADRLMGFVVEGHGE